MDLSAVTVDGEGGLIEVLDLANARLTSGGSEVKFDCFGAEHSDGGAAYINVETTAWICHGCKRRGNAITLVQEVLQVDKPQAQRWLRNHYGIDFLEPAGGSMVAETEVRFRETPPEPDPPRPPLSWLVGCRVDWADARWDVAHEAYMLRRGFSSQTLSEWDIGYDYETDRITIPVFDLDGELVGIKARTWQDGVEPKYRVLGDMPNMTRFGFAPYDPRDVVFGLHRARGHRTAVVFEGEFNAIAAAQLGIARPVATGMSYFPKRHAELLAREVDEVILFYDYGPAGEAGIAGFTGSDGQHNPGAIELLEPYVRVRVVDPLPDDPAKLVELGRGREVLELVSAASSSLARRITFV